MLLGDGSSDGSADGVGGSDSALFVHGMLLVSVCVTAVSSLFNDRIVKRFDGVPLQQINMIMCASQQRRSTRQGGAASASLLALLLLRLRLLRLRPRLRLRLVGATQSPSHQHAHPSLPPSRPDSTAGTPLGSSSRSRRTLPSPPTARRPAASSTATTA